MVSMAQVPRASAPSNHKFQHERSCVKFAAVSNGTGYVLYCRSLLQVVCLSTLISSPPPSSTSISPICFFLRPSTHTTSFHHHLQPSLFKHNCRSMASKQANKRLMKVSRTCCSTRLHLLTIHFRSCSNRNTPTSTRLLHPSSLLVLRKAISSNGTTSSEAHPIRHTRVVNVC